MSADSITRAIALILLRLCLITYSRERIDEALALVAEGRNYLQVSKLTGISRSAIRDWSDGKLPQLARVEGARSADPRCSICMGTPGALSTGSYAYLLGLYLGDGCLSESNKGVFLLRITCCNAYPDLMDECELAISDVLSNKVGRVRLTGCTEVHAGWKHWPCLFPQHGPGPKHKRSIVLADWQRDIVQRMPAPFVRGLIHSDGCRVLNWVNNTPYPRYHFSNTSADIRGLFGWACDLLGVDWRPNNATNLSVARRDSPLPRHVHRAETLTASITRR